MPILHFFEDNARNLQLTNEPKHIKYHHFRQYVKNRTISMQAICTDDQQADIFAKPLAKDKFEKFRRLIMGW